MLHGVGAGAVATLLGTMSNLLLLPLYLSHWSVTIYGEWMALFSTVNYFGALDFGLTTAATNAAAHAYAAQDWPEFRRIQGTAWGLSIGIATLGILIGTVLLSLFAVQSWLALKAMTLRESRLVFATLLLTFLVGIPGRQLTSTYIAAGNFARYQWIYNIGQALTLMVTGIALFLGADPVRLSSIVAVTTLLLFLLTYGLIRRYDPQLAPRLRDASWKTTRSLASPSGQFLVQMVANTIALQGPVTVISRVLGGQGVALFTTTRTVSNAVRAILTIFRAPLRPEYAAAYAEAGKERLRSLFRSVLALDTTIAVSLMAAIWTGGAWLIRIWSHGQIAPDIQLLDWLLCFSLLEGFFWMLAGAGNAANRFHGVSLGFLAYAVVSLALSVSLVHSWGISAIPKCAVVSLLAFMFPAALRNAQHEIGLSLGTLTARICIPFTVITVLSMLISVKVASFRFSPEWMGALIASVAACVASIIGTSMTMLTSEDRQIWLSRIAR